MTESETLQRKYSIISQLSKIAVVKREGRKKTWSDPDGGYFRWVQDNWTAKGEPLDFDSHRYLKQIYLDQSPEIIYMKSAQTGLTERGLTEAIWLPDQFKENAIYVFPTSGTVSDLVQERIDDPLNNKTYLRQVSGRAKRILGKQADKIGLKRMSRGFIYFRGSNKPTQITSVPADAIFVDEVDRMVQENIPYIPKRLGHSKRKWQRWFSTPTIPDFGIHRMFMDTDQMHYYIPCPHCGEEQHLDFFKNVEFELIDNTHCRWAKIVCVACRKDIVPYAIDGTWKPHKPEATKRGYFVSALYSPRIDLVQMVNDSLKTAEWEIQQFYNQDLGLPYEPKGGRITEEMLNACSRDYSVGLKEGDNFMGVDVGRVLHVMIQNSLGKVVYIDTVKNFEDLDPLMKEYNIKKAVVDALPETRESQKFADRFQGRVMICYYSGLTEVKMGEWFKIDGQKINTDRTLSLDMWTARFKTQNVELPKNVTSLTEFKEHMKALTRVVREEKGNQKAEYLQVGPDHFYHAGNYSNLAKAAFENIFVPEVFMI